MTSVQKAETRLDRKRHHAETVRRALQEVMDYKGWSIHNWCTRSGIAEGTLRNFLARRTEDIQLTTVMGLAEAAGTSMGKMVGEIPVDTADDDIVIPTVEAYAPEPGARAIVEEGLGPGFRMSATMAEEQFDTPIDALRIIRPIRSDEMSPSIARGAIVFVNKNDIDLDRSGVFALHDGVNMVVRRVAVVASPDTGEAIVQISPDNKAYMSYSRPLLDITPIGRVVFALNPV